MRHRVFIGFIIAEAVCLLFFYLFSLLEIERRRPEVDARRELVRVLMLTDLAVWTEARYTRHPSQADLFSPFQDSPSSIEHFPAGSLIAPPWRGGRRGGYGHHFER